MRRREAWIIAAALAAATAWAAFRAPSRVLPAIEAAGASTPYVECGEILLHGFDPGRSACPSLYMPLSSLTAARLFSHAPPAGRPWRGAVLAIGLLSVAALCALAGSPRAGLAAVLLLLAFPGLWPEHGSYVQFFYAPFVLAAAAALVWREADPSPARTALLAAAIGASVLFRSPLAFFPPLLVLADRFRRRPDSARSGRLDAALLLTVPYLPLLPWAVMNRVLHRQWSFFERGESLPNIVTAALGRARFLEQDWRAAVRAEPLLQSQLLLDHLRWAFAEIALHPLRYLAGAGGRLVFVVGLHPWLFAAAAAGAWRARASAPVRALTALCLYFLLVHCSIAVLDNYMVPLWPLLACLAAMLARSSAEEPSAKALGGPARAWLLLLVAGLGLAALEAEGRAARYAWLAGARAPGSEAALAEALRAAPEDGWLHYQSGWRRLRDGDRAGAAAEWTAAARLRPDVPLWDLHRVWALQLAGNPRPLLDWNRALPPWSTQGQLADPDLLRANAELRAGRTASARARLRGAYERLLLAEGEGQELMSLEMLWDRSRELFGSLPPGEWIGLWDALYRLRDDAPGRAVSLRGDPMRDAVVRLQNAGSYREALALLSRLLAHRPDSPALWTDKAVNETLAGSWDKAVPDLERAIKADERFWPAYLSLGAVLVKLGRPAEAVKVYDRALAAGRGAPDEPMLAEIRAARSETARGR